MYLEKGLTSFSNLALETFANPARERVVNSDIWGPRNLDGDFVHCDNSIIARYFRS